MLPRYDNHIIIKLRPSIAAEIRCAVEDRIKFLKQRQRLYKNKPEEKFYKQCLKESRYFLKLEKNGLAGIIKFERWK